MKKLREGWALISSRVKIGPPEEMDHFLGCKRILIECEGIKGVKYDMRDFFRSTIALYESLSQRKVVELRPDALTPYSAKCEPRGADFFHRRKLFK